MCKFHGINLDRTVFSQDPAKVDDRPVDNDAINFRVRYTARFDHVFD